MQNEKLSETAQSASREMERELLKQGSIFAEVSAKLAAAEQEMNAISRSAEGMRKDRAAMEKFAADTLKRIGAEIAAVRGSMAAKNGELIASRNQRLALSRNLQREIGRLDSMIAVQGGAAAGLEATRDKLRRDSAAAESSIAEAALRSSLAIRRQDSLAALLQGQIAECAMKVEKALRDSITASAPVSSSAQHTVTALDTLIASKERELADLRGQREKARQDAAKDQRKQSADRTVMHQNIMNQRQAAQRRQAEMASMTAQRGKLQQDSAAALSRIQSEIKASGAEILRHTSLVAAKKAELAELTAKRADLAAKLSIMGMEPQQAAASAPASQAAASSAAAQKTVEEIYTLIGSDKIDEAVGRFNAQRSFLSASVNPEAFQVLNYAIDQAMASRKTAAKK
jgi:chromosome segregation ATPase